MKALAARAVVLRAYVVVVALRRVGAEGRVVAEDLDVPRAEPPRARAVHGGHRDLDVVAVLGRKRDGVVAARVRLRRGQRARPSLDTVDLDLDGVVSRGGRVARNAGALVELHLHFGDVRAGKVDVD